MAEVQNGSTKTSESVKLFVGQVPKHMTESQLLSIFQDAVNVQAINIIKDKITQESRGCCFVTCSSRQEADKAISLFHNKRTLPGAASPMQVKYADGELERIEHKLFIGMLPKSVSDVDVSAVFSKFGTIKELQILRGSQQTNRGCAFLKYETKDQAVAALEAINGKYKMEGSSFPLVVKWADTEKERQARRAQRAQAQAPNTPSTDSGQQPSLFGAMPMGYMPTSSYNGYGFQAPGTYGLMQYPLPALPSHQPGLHGMVAAVNPASTLSGGTPDLVSGITPTSFAAIQSAGYMSSAYPAVSGVQYPMAYQGPMIGHGTVPAAHGSIGTTLLNINSAAGNINSASGNVKTSSGAQVEGPPGANLFIYHIPQEFGDQELSNAFSSFGRVISAKVFVDKATGASKCFGFVSYDSPAAAQSAINVMNGFQLSGKKLKVQLKRDNKQSKPY